MFIIDKGVALRGRDDNDNVGYDARRNVIGDNQAKTNLYFACYPSVIIALGGDGGWSIRKPNSL